MKVLLISANTETINMVPLSLGLNCVAVAVRNAGHEVRLVDLMGNGDSAGVLRQAVEAFQPGVIGISARNVDNQQMGQTRFLLEPVREIVSLCRALSQAPVVIGGAGFSIFPEAALAYLQADMGICGEGERAFVALLEALQGTGDLSQVPGLVLPGRPVQLPDAARGPLEGLPFADPALWSVPEAAGELWIPVQTRRGCPMNCSYCSTPALEGARIRTRPAETVVAAVRRHVAAGFERFYFVDNTFNFPLRYAKDLCLALKEAGLKIRWRCILYPAFLDEELVRLMAEAGCVEVSLGFESGSCDVLDRLRKKFDPRQVRLASELLRRYGIVRMGFLLLGGPGETRESVQESLDFAESLKLDMLKLTIGIRIYPNTPLAEVARQEGVVAADDDLLLPRFYLAKGLDGWLQETVTEWMSSRAYCMS